MKLNILSNKVAWFGKYSGYECLPDYFPASQQVSLHIAQYNLVNKVFGKVYKMKHNWDIRSEDIYNEVRFLRGIRSSTVSHILYLENHLHMLEKVQQPEKLLATIHLPFSQWSKKRLDQLGTLQNALFLYDEEVEEFSPYLPADGIRIIKHGVDNDFFTPAKPQQVNRFKMLFVGHFLRNFSMMARVFDMVRKDVHSNMEFHFIIPPTFRNIPELVKLASEKGVFFHANLSDEELLEQYQQSNLMVMPMNDSGANTAIVQSLATGLPIVTTNVGGIKSYGGDSVFPIVENNDALAMTDLISQYFNNEDLRNTVSEKQRNFSLEYLDWRKVCDEHFDLYRQLMLQVA